MKRHSPLKARFFLTLVGLSACAFGGEPTHRGSSVSPQRFDLPTAISFALENNFAIRQARARIRAQDGIVTTVRAAALPGVAIGGSYQHSEIATVQTPAGGPVVISPEGPSWRMTLNASQLLFAGGGVRASIRRAEITREAAVLEFQALLNNALLEVRTRFFDVLLAREQIKVQEQNLELLRDQLRYATARAQVGSTSDFQRLRAEVAVANATTPLIRARNDHRLAIEEFRRALGFTSDSDGAGNVLELVGTLAFRAETVDLQQALELAQAQRPELQRFTKLVAAGDEGVSVARARYFPNLSVSGGADLRRGGTESFSDSVSGMRAGLRSQLEVTRATAGVVAQATSQVAQLRLLESEAKLAIDVEVRRALFALEQSAELAGAMQKTVGQAEEAVPLATARFEAGTATQLDVLQSQVELTSARSNAVRANHGYNVALARLRVATGLPDVDYKVGQLIPETLEREAAKR